MQQEIKNNKLIIFDTTLRDGEQSPGASMTQEEKLRIARQLEKLGVDVIEAGFAAASPGDFESIGAVAKHIKESTICSLARAVENDIRKAGEAIRHAKKGVFTHSLRPVKFIWRINSACQKMRCWIEQSKPLNGL